MHRKNEIKIENSELRKLKKEKLKLARKHRQNQRQIE